MAAEVEVLAAEHLHQRESLAMPQHTCGRFAHFEYAPLEVLRKLLQVVPGQRLDVGCEFLQRQHLVVVVPDQQLVTGSDFLGRVELLRLARPPLGRRSHHGRFLAELKSARGLHRSE